MIEWLGLYLWRAGLHLQDFKVAGVRKVSGDLPPKLNRSSRWSPHSEGIFKLNVDAALDVAGGRFGSGVIVRNSAGDPCLAAVILNPGSFGVELAEAKALKDGINLAVTHGLLPLVIESDSSIVVSLCNNLISSRAEIDNIV
ncbi:hypothetical protein ACOSQ3_002716 [Xanthoceras sorbifolium]